MKLWGRLQRRGYYRKALKSIFILMLFTITPASWATESQTDNETANSEINIMQAKDAGVAINGSVKDSSVNSNENVLTTGNNTNVNVLAPTVLTPTQSVSTASSSGGTGGTGGTGGVGVGGNSVLMLPRNPLPLSNAALGRSNFGLQFGLQNNPILGSLGSLGGKQNALGWYMQAGLTIPFGKIPSALANTGGYVQLDDTRQKNQENRRNIFGEISPSDPGGMDVKTKLNGKIVGMGAYNYSTIPSARIALPNVTLDKSGDGQTILPPRLLALAPSEVYSKPLNVGEKIGLVEVGNEYPYLGHTRSGWIKILMPNGKEGWTSTHFEYIKHDFTEIDSLALDPNTGKKDKTSSSSLSKLGFEKAASENKKILEDKKVASEEKSVKSSVR